MKTLEAAPPDALMCNEKYIRQHQVLNITGVIYTTNYEDGLYLPANDRRHYVVMSEIKKEEFAEDYFDKLYAWYHSGGFENIATFLASYDLSEFNPKAPPPKRKPFGRWSTRTGRTTIWRWPTRSTRLIARRRPRWSCA
jgi:hypothetical protein